MKAVTCAQYGSPDVLQVRDIPRPVPGPGEVLVQVRATTVTAADYRVRGLNVPAGFRLITRLAMGLRRPRKGILGREFAGEVTAGGSRVTSFRVGDQVFGTTNFGTNAEYVCVPANGALVEKPENLSHEEAAAIPFGGLTALYFLRDRAGLRQGQSILIYGASGSVGVAAVQLARHYGAKVTAVCGPTNMDLVGSLGAHQVLDYTKDDFRRNGRRYDVIFETVGKVSISDCEKSLSAGGVCLPAVAGLPDYLRMLRNFLTGGPRVISGVAGEKPEDLRYLSELARTGKLKPVIDRRYSLEETADAHRYADLGHKKGSVVIVPG